MQLIEQRNIRKFVYRISVLRLTIVILFLSNILNIGNYSFLSYSFAGFPISIVFFDFLKYFRLPMILIGLLTVVILLLKNHKLSGFFLYNIDVFIFLFFTYLGLINSIDIINGIFYTLWLSGATILGLSFMFYLKTYCFNQKKFHIFFKFIFWSNFIVLPFLILNINSIGKSWSFDMAFSSSTFYPYCLFSMLISLYGCRLFTTKSIFKSKFDIIIEILVILIIIFFCFLSARRTPLFLMIILTFIFSFYAVGKSIFKKILLSIFLIFFGILITPKLLKYIEKHKYELSILKKVNDIQNSKGDISKDASYNERIMVWNLYNEIINMHPIIGTGSYNSSLFLKEIFPNSRLNGYSTHNLYRGILVEHGFLGLLSFMVVLFRSSFLILLTSSIKHSYYYFTFLLIPVIIINWNEYNLLAGQVFFWTTLLIILFPRILK